MSKGQLHLGVNGPTPCNAERGGCPYEDGGHFDNEKDAEQAFATLMGGVTPKSFNKNSEEITEEKLKVSIDLGYESIEVDAGDLSNPEVRMHFADGLCGDLANAIHMMDSDRKLYFSLDTNSEGRPNTKDLEKMDSIDDLSEFVFHAVVECKSEPGKFLDAYGVKTKEEIEEHFGGPLVEAPSHIFTGFTTQADHDLSSFAEAALALERTGKSYSYKSFEG